MCAVKNLLRTFRRVLGTSSRNYFLRRRTQKTQQGADVLEGEGEQSASSEGGVEGATKIGAGWGVPCGRNVHAPA